MAQLQLMAASLVTVVARRRYCFQYLYAVSYWSSI